jgi:hypothetical protein
MQHQAKEADIHALSELKRALDKKVSPPTFYAPKLIFFLCSSFGKCFTFTFHLGDKS